MLKISKYLPEINVWLDVIWFALLLIMFLFWYVIHFAGNWLTGRAYKRFVKWEWPPHEEVIPPTPKIMHGIHVVGMICLALSGLYIRFPFVYGLRDAMRYLHYTCGVIVTINFVSRVVYAFNVDKNEFILRWHEIKAMPAVLMYYLFIKSEKPHLAKYNPLQKMTYLILFPIPLAFMVYTGFAMLFPTPLLFWATPFVGEATALAWTRVIHYCLCMLLIMFTLIHVYLSVTEGLTSFLDFFGIVPITHVEHVPHAEHGHMEGHLKGHEIKGHEIKSEHHEVE
ncbi:MAG: cytochrome b/b6 domain-containing protein [Actinomycetota bacterium]|nr:cytochrome b/b6 domain-containing protein [Actinomycetota bacterium]MDI6821798.1 cytochrome b/b6 domain-containing protein [Actinomycetota bacterium]